MSNEKYISPEIDVMAIEVENAIMAMSTELLDYDENVWDL